MNTKQVLLLIFTKQSDNLLIFSLVIVAGDMICFVDGNKLGSAGVNNLVKRGL